MAATLQDIEKQALWLSSRERGALIRRFIVSLESVPEDSPVSIANAWDEEMARRTADREAGRTQWTPAAEVMSGIRALIEPKNLS